MIGIVVLSLLALAVPLSGMTQVKADSANFQVTVVKSDFSGWANVGVEVWNGTTLLDAGNTNSNGDVFFSLPVGRPYKFLAGDASATASVSAVPDAVLVGVILMPTVVITNQPPVADAGPDQTVEQSSYAGADVTLDGSGSSDPDGDPLTYQWTWDGSSASGVNPTATFPLGSTTVTLTVSDGELSDTDTVAIEVVDTTLPVVDITSPEDGKTYLNTEGSISVQYTATDICDSDLTITMTLDGNPFTGDEINLCGMASGEHTLVVSAADDSGNTGNASATFMVLKASQTITFGVLATKTYGDPPFDVSATASSGLAVSFSILSGPATISINTVTITGAGPVTVRASQSGNDDYNAAPDVDQSFTVNKAGQTITFGPLTGKTYGDPPFDVSATASSGLAVSFSILSGPATISINTVTITGAGPVTVRASQLGDTNYDAAPNVDQPFTVNKANTTTAIASSNNPSLFGVPLTFTATVTATPPGGSIPTGLVNFKDNSTPIVPAVTLVNGQATWTTSSLALGSHTIGANYAGDSNYKSSSATSVTVQIDPSATLNVKYIIHALQDDSPNPKVKKEPVEGADVRVYSMAHKRVAELDLKYKPKAWGKIFEELPSVVLTYGNGPVKYEAKGFTDANGMVSIIVPPTPKGVDYAVIGRTKDYDVTKTPEDPDSLYSGGKVNNIAAGDKKDVKLNKIRLFNGKKVPAKFLEEFGTYLEIIEPEYVDWTADVQQYPFIYVSIGDWTVVTGVIPPEGFIADASQLSTDVNTGTTAVQFTLTDVGSKWTTTAVTHTIKHKGKIKVRSSDVSMFDKKPPKPPKGGGKAGGK
jgi:hypothetical protein